MLLLKYIQEARVVSIVYIHGLYLRCYLLSLVGFAVYLFFVEMGKRKAFKE